GAFLGAGAIYYRYGFRHDPYEARYELRAGYATEASTYRAEFTADLTRASSRYHVNLFAPASGIEIVRFFHFGHETGAGEANSKFCKEEQKQYTLFPSFGLGLGDDAMLSFGPVVKYANTELNGDRFIDVARPYGSGKFGQAGLRAGWRWDTRDVPA